jgi:hypothetical protein
MKLLKLLEGGNVFKTADGQPATQRINRADVPATIAWLESVLGMPFPENRWLGSTGRAPTSGDLDLAVDLKDADKETIAQRLAQFVQQQKQDPREWVRKSGEVHFKTPIGGDARNGFVQTDFMFFNNVDWGTFFYAGGTDSAYKGMVRNVLMSSLAKHLGLKVGANGMFSRTTNELVRNGLNPDYVAQVLLGAGHDRDDLKNVETIYQNLARDPERDAKLADFREYLRREGLQEPEMAVKESDVNFLARLRDRIVNQGMQPILEAEAAGVGGRAKGIEHLEDLVFRRGTQGIVDALTIVQQATEQPSTVTAKWDGKPAVIFGRKPSTGEFVLTDGSGFEAKGYDGLATSPQMMADIQSRRSGDRSELIDVYRRLFPVLEAALPSNFRGYVKGDLLYMNRPPVVSGNYVFKPNTIEYRIPATSSLGKRIANSEIGIAVHSMYADVGEPRQPLSRVTFQEVPGLMLERPATPRQLEADPAIVKQLKQLVRQDGTAINTLFNPVELRAHKITDLARLCVDFINTKVGAPLNPQTLLPEFGDWLQSRVTPQKFRNIVEYLQSPSSNTPALAAAFTAFILLHDLKMHLLRQADTQHPGQEGWVMATPAGYAKAVNRFDPAAFAAVNRQQNNPK